MTQSPELHLWRRGHQRTLNLHISRLKIRPSCYGDAGFLFVHTWTWYNKMQNTRDRTNFVIHFLTCCKHRKNFSIRENSTAWDRRCKVRVTRLKLNQWYVTRFPCISMSSLHQTYAADFIGHCETALGFASLDHEEAHQAYTLILLYTLGCFTLRTSQKRVPYEWRKSCTAFCI